MSNSTHICAPCRRTARVPGICPSCGSSLKNMGTRWRPPRKTDDRAWKKIQAGNPNTEPVKPTQGTGTPYVFTSPALPMAPKKSQVSHFPSVEEVINWGQNVPTEALSHPFATVRKTIALYTTSHQAWLRLLSDADEQVSAAALSRSVWALPDGKEKKLAVSKSVVTRKALAARVGISNATVATLARDLAEVQQVLGANTSVDPKFLAPLPWVFLVKEHQEALLADSRTRQLAQLAAEANPNLTVGQAQKLLDVLT